MKRIPERYKQLSIDKWQWLHDNPLKITWDMEDENLKLYKKLNSFQSRCPLCELFMENDCIGCPVMLKDILNCFGYNSLYHRWANAETEKQSQLYSGKLLKIMKEL